MSYIMRMISPMQEWTQKQHDILNPSMICADAITDLDTENNGVSTWSVGDKSKGEVKNGVLALTSGFNSLEDIRVVFLDEKELTSVGLKICETEGDTPIEELKHLHREICELNSGKLAILAQKVLECVWEERVYDIHKDTIQMWLIDALNKRMLSFNSLKKNVRPGLAKNINRMIASGEMSDNDIISEVKESVNIQIEKNNRKTNCAHEGECEFYSKKVNS